MPSFFIQGQARVEPAINPEFAHSIVPETLEPYGMGRIGCYADQGGTVMKISQTVDGPTAREAVESFRLRFDEAERRRQQESRVIRFSFGPYEPEWVSEWSIDGSDLGPPRPWTPARLRPRLTHSAR